MILEQITLILNFIVEAFLHIWPYLLLTIPLAVIVNMSGASKYISRAFQARPIIAIFLATAVGAFSPFCSCGVIPVVAAMLIGGVPLAPVMSFWIASPSMDPEAFFLSVATIGWELAVWRLVGTLILSLAAGFITHFAQQRGWFGEEILRPNMSFNSANTVDMLRGWWRRLRPGQVASPQLNFAANVPMATPAESCCEPAPINFAETLAPVALADAPIALTSVEEAASTDSCCEPAPINFSETLAPVAMMDAPLALTPVAAEEACCEPEKPAGFWERLLNETWAATMLVAKFMALAFFLEALIELYVPSELIVGLLGQGNQLAIFWAAILGVPTYTSNLAALPMVKGLLALGMSPAAALAFLIAGPTTTLPAMSAVWGIVTRKVFFVYAALSLVGAVMIGYLYMLVSLFSG